MHRSPILAAAVGTSLLVLSGAALPADLLDGTVLAYDRKARIIVLADKSVMPLANLQGEMPEDLVAGDRIEISFESNEDDGIYVVHGVKRID